MAVASTVTLLAGTAQAANASALTSSCFTLPFGSCRTDFVRAASGNWLHYSIAPCGWGKIYDNDTGRQVGPSKAYGGGYIEGVYGYNYYMILQSAGSACLGSLGY
ncbi:hypothetical protein Aab01nite_04880 [Paractinoplanes abujensis]|nr:hypothetical protein Aab01nite_04880 [Actinoplanes abujensis]